MRSKQAISMNILGSGRAEADSHMLKTAFYYTQAYYSITESRDYSFIIGRRGTGKSALFLKSIEKFQAEKNKILIQDFPDEDEILALKARILSFNCATYKEGRAITNLIWKVFICSQIIKKLIKHYKYKDSDGANFINKWIDTHFVTFKSPNLFSIFNNFIRNSKHEEKKLQVDEIPHHIVRHYDIKKLLSSVESSLKSCRLESIVMIDGLDEGWSSNEISTSILGGLAYFSSKLKDKPSQIHIISFVRDNMFRALSDLDQDFSRNIESEVLRLTWSEEALFNLTIFRIKESLALQKQENQMKVWERLVSKELKGKQGFHDLLKNTLYRPRDVLALINSSYSITRQNDREKIIPEDIEHAVVQISKNRYQDLHKEYHDVFPGLVDICEIFRKRKVKYNFKKIIDIIGKAQDDYYINPKTRSGDIGLFTNPNDLFFSLFSVGFLGRYEEKAQSYLFCHDGSQTSISQFAEKDIILIHPCYWRALELEIKDEKENINILLTLNDEYGEVVNNDEIKEFRHKLIGQVHNELSSIPCGQNGWKAFEKWSYRAIKLLTVGSVDNIELSPNRDAIQRRDLVGTLDPKKGIWQRIQNDYKVRQIVFEIKNYDDLSIDNFRQMSGYLTRQYGQLGFIIKRNSNFGPTKKEISWAKEIYNEHKNLIIILTDSLINKSISKLRGEKKETYFEGKIKKLLDDYERKYLSNKH